MNHTPAYSIDKSATRRKNGLNMYDMYVMHPIGINEVAYTINSDFGNKINDLTRKGIFDAIAAGLRIGSFSEGMWDDVSEEEMEEAYRIARILFPELSDEKLQTRT